MGFVRILQDDVINKIAAGEVVERPASVVKELVDNAIDAGATQITVKLEEGGTKAIRVYDNGSGMDRDDALLAFTRHATSKIMNVDDLFDISSNGFRGEALASISSVARVTLQTMPSGAKSGTRVSNLDSEKLEANEWQSAQSGTQIHVENLFYNVPARKRFMKSAPTEFAHCHEFLQAIGICYPRVNLKLEHNGKEVLSLSPSQPETSQWLGEGCFRARARALIKHETLEKLMYTRHQTDMGAVELLLSPPGFEKPTGKHLYTFANGRWVKDKLLRMGVMRGYHSHILKGRYPVCIVRLSVEPSLVDVNVHPAKTEMRFQYGSEIQNLIAVAIKEKIRSGAWASVPTTPRESSSLAFDAFLPVSTPARPATESASVTNSVARKPSSEMVKSYRAATQAPAYESLRPAVHESVQQRQPEIVWSELRFIGAFNKCFLFFESRQGLMVMDQHAFHERVLYERFINDDLLTKSSQALLMPEEVTLAPVQLRHVVEMYTELKKFGFEYEALNDSSIEVRALPAIIAHRSPDEIFEALLADYESGSVGESNRSLHHLIVATMACHSAVRAGEELGENELRKLLGEAQTVDFYHNCPHGRPVFKWFSGRQVEGWFERT